MQKKNEKVEMLFQIKANQIREASEMLIEKTLDWQVIKKFMVNRFDDIVLTAQQKKKLERYQFIYNQLCDGKYTDSQVVTMNSKFYSVSLQQSYDDIRCTRELFNSVININRQFELNNELQIAKKARAKALEVLDHKSAAAYGKLIRDILALLPEQDDSPGINFEGHFIEAIFNPELLGAPKVDMMEVLKAINAKRKAPIKTDMFDFLDSESLSNEETTPL